MNIEISGSVFFQALLLLLLCQALVFFKFKNIIYSQQKKIKFLKNDVQALLLCARGVGEKLHCQQSEFRYIQERQDKLEINEGNHGMSYKQIMGLMGQGVSRNEMMSSCDLTQGEVDLMAHLQKNQKNPRSPQNQNLHI